MNARNHMKKEEGLKVQSVLSKTFISVLKIVYIDLVNFCM